MTDSAQFTANVTILSSDTRHRDLETRGMGQQLSHWLLSAPTLRCATSEFSVATWLSRSEDVTKLRSPSLVWKWA